MTKHLYIISGPNGSGKSTFAKEFLPKYAHCPNFINADLIAQGLSPFSPEKAAVTAGRLVLKRIKSFSNTSLDFGFETTLSGKTYIKYLTNIKKLGYQINLFFLWIPNSKLAIERIKERVIGGGHNVPTKDVIRRYQRSIYNFFNLYRNLVDSWMLFDNSDVQPNLIASQHNNLPLNIKNKELFNNLLNKYGEKND
jgi:predicted ABC-type ATPase